MISVLIPTKGRAQSLQRCIKSIDVPARVIVTAHSLSDIAEVKGIDVFQVDSSLSVIGAQIASFSKAEGDVIVCCDDVEFMPGAISKAQSLLGNGVVGFNQINVPGGSPYAFMLISEAYHKEFGFLHSGYKHFYADTEYGELVQERGRFIFGADCHVKHYHPCVTKVEDATHLCGRDYKLEHDSKLYALRKANREKLGVRSVLHAGVC